MSLDEKGKMWSVGYDKMYVKYNLLCSVLTSLSWKNVQPS